MVNRSGFEGLPFVESAGAALGCNFSCNGDETSRAARLTGQLDADLDHVHWLDLLESGAFIKVK